jgi:hypothetical protein
MDSPIIARYDMDADEMIRAFEAHARWNGVWASRPQRQRQALIIGIMALFAGFALMQTRDQRWWFALLALASLLLLLHSPEWTWSIQKTWLRFRARSTPLISCVWRISDQGLSQDSPEGAEPTGRLTWDRVARVVEIEGDYLVYPCQGPFIWLPREAFAHNAAEQFRELTRNAGKLWARKRS